MDLGKIELVDISNLDSEGMTDNKSDQKFEWNSTLNIADILIALRNNMHLRSVCNNSAMDEEGGEDEEGEDEGLY